MIRYNLMMQQYDVCSMVMRSSMMIECSTVEVQRSEEQHGDGGTLDQWKQYAFYSAYINYLICYLL